MAIKHVVTDGIGFTVPSYLLTEGFGNFSAAGGGGSVGGAVGSQQTRWVTGVGTEGHEAMATGTTIWGQPFTITTP